jgi:hypothetical protein
LRPKGLRASTATGIMREPVAVHPVSHVSHPAARNGYTAFRFSASIVCWCSVNSLIVDSAISRMAAICFADSALCFLSLSRSQRPTIAASLLITLCATMHAGSCGSLSEAIRVASLLPLFRKECARRFLILCLPFLTVYEIRTNCAAWLVWRLTAYARGRKRIGLWSPPPRRRAF